MLMRRPLLDHAIRWIISTTVSEGQLAALPRAVPPGHARLVMVGRDLDIQAVSLALRALPLLGREFPLVRREVVGTGGGRSRG
jgi:hypothetical protein